ncbi:MAG TPA: hypothetical protein VFQ02_08255, partial [Nitrospira sp.]|nr:hypothetical protein [Nitrospira sp.]
GIISPSTFGGYLLAAAVGHPHFTEYVQDLLTAGGRVTLTERQPKPEEIGQSASALKPDILLRLHRRGEVYNFWDLQEGQKMEAGDTLLILTSAIGTSASRQDQSKAA